MTADLDTLLREAGREPTIDPDVDTVHARGRRRATARRVAAGAGTLVVLAAVGLGIATLADQPETPIVDQAPDTAPGVEQSEEAEATFDSAALLQDEALADRLGVATVRIVDDGGGPDVVRAGFGPDPSISQYGTSTAVPLWGVTVGGDGSVWFTDTDERLLVLPSDPDPPYDGTSMADVVGEAETGVAWRVLGPDGRGGVLVGQLTSGEQGETFSLHRVEGTTLGGPEPGHGDLLDHIDGDGTPFVAASGAETPQEVAVVDAVGESYGVTVLRAGGDGPTAFTALTSGGLDHWLGDVVVVGRDVLVLEAGADGDTDLLVYGLDDGQLRRVATPLGRAYDGYALELSAAAGDGGTHIALSAASDAGVEPTSWIVEAAALTAAAAPSEPMAPGPDLVDGLWEPTGLAGHLSLLPRPDRATTGPAACGSEDRNGPPEVNGEHLWFACYGDGSSLDPFPFFRVDLDPMEAQGVDLLRRLVTEFLAGPAPGDEARDLQALAPPGSVALTDITTEGSRATITVDTVGETGVPTGATDGWAFRVALAAVALQFDAYDEAVVVTDGVCGDWEGVTDSAAADECIVWTEQDMPWNQ